MNKQSQKKYLCEVISVAMVMMTQSVIAADEAENTTAILPSIEVEGEYQSQALSSEQTGEYKIEKSRGSTRLNLDIKDTPQSISVITRQQLDDFSVTTLNDALELIPSINVERHETDRTYYNARGFEITNFQVDGLGVPLSQGVGWGQVDTVTYDRIEVLRGANGLVSGTGDPSATVNSIRKRPTDEFQASVSGLAGSWDQYRAEADISGSLNEAKTIRGRVVAAHEDKDSYLDRYAVTRDVLYGVLDFQLSDTSMLTMGHTYQSNEADSPLWGALPLVYTDGSETNFDESSSSAASWSQANTEINNSFAELQLELSRDWQAIAQLSRKHTRAYTPYFYAYGTPDSDSGAGMGAYPRTYHTEEENYIADAYASGLFSLAGREHELVVGTQWTKSSFYQFYNAGSGVYTPMTIDEVLAGSFPEPSTYGPDEVGADWTYYQRSAYSSSKLNMTDNFHVILGARYLDYDLTGTSYGQTQDRTASEVVPYAGAVYSLTDLINVYASYTEIFNPQYEKDINSNLLDPTEGKTYEVGLKMDLNNGLAFASISLFKTEQDNVAVAQGNNPDTQETYYSAEDGVTSEGVELDIAGEVVDGLVLMGGYAYVDIKDADGNRTKLYTPKQTFKLASTYQIPSIPEWKVGANVRWQSEIKDTSVNVTQGSYAVWGAMTSYQITPNLSTALNIYNLFDEKYYTTFRWNSGQAYYAEPRSAVVSMNYDF